MEDIQFERATEANTYLDLQQDEPLTFHPHQESRQYEELCRQIEAIISNKDSYRLLLAQEGECAQKSLDTLQHLYESPHISSKLRSDVFTAMTRLSHCSGLYPSCLVLNDVEGISKYPVVSGGFGDIYTGFIGDQMACLKVVRIYGEEDTQKFAKAFLKEAILWKQLSHPNVLPFLGLYFLDATKQRICLISPWMANGSLKRYLSKRSVEFEDRIRLAYDIACGLSYLHDEKIIHGDLKGDNVLISNTGRASIADFGLSRLVNSDAIIWTSVSTSNHGRGSTRWLAPECLLENKPVTYSSDIYALGGVCYEVFTGLVPFYEFIYDGAVPLQLQRGERPSRPLGGSGLTDPVWAVLQDCWSQETPIRPTAKSLPGRFASIASKDISPAENWDKSLPSRLWESVQRSGIRNYNASMGFIQETQGVTAGSPNPGLSPTSKLSSIRSRPSPPTPAMSSPVPLPPLSHDLPANSIDSIAIAGTRPRPPPRASRPIVHGPSYSTGSTDQVYQPYSENMTPRDTPSPPPLPQPPIPSHTEKCFHSVSASSVDYPQSDSYASTSSQAMYANGINGADHDPYVYSAGPSNGFASNPEFYPNPVDTGQSAFRDDYEPDDGDVDVGVGVDDDDYYWEDEGDKSRFVNFFLLSYIAVQLKDKVPRGTHVKGGIPYLRTFTGRGIVSTIQSLIQRELAINHDAPTSDRRAALQVARSLQSQLFFHEIEWGRRVLQDGVEDLYMFLDDQDGPSDAVPERAEMPTGVVTALTKCYSPDCIEGNGCYSPTCPRKGDLIMDSIIDSTIDPIQGEINRQAIIHKLISREESYIADLDTIESAFIRPLRSANPPVISSFDLDKFIDEVFGNILDLRECNKRLLEVMYARQREQFPVIQRIGDVFLKAAAEFRLAYPFYIGRHPLAEEKLKEEMKNNGEFRLFIEQCSRTLPDHSSDNDSTGSRLNLRHYLNRPCEHLQKYPVLLEAILKETVHENPDADYLSSAISAISSLQSSAQLHTFQNSMGRGVPGKWEWRDMVSRQMRAGLNKREVKRQSIIWELIKGEMAYVKDLENIEVMYIRPLRVADPPIIHSDRLDRFINEVFHNFAELHARHRRLVEKFHEIQRDEHPVIRSITAAVFDAVLNFRDAYMEYIPNYPIASYKIDDECANNPAFKTFVESAARHPDVHGLDMKNFINRPIPRLLRYELLLKGILDETPMDHDDRVEIPQVLEVIKALGKESELGVISSKQKVELWKYNSNIVFKPGEWIDMDLLNKNRSLIHFGRLLRQPDSGLEWKGWSELFVLLFDNYLVITKAREKDGNTKYYVNRRPIPLDLLTLVNFTSLPTQRGAGLLRNLRSGERRGGTADPVYPCTIHHNGRMGSTYILYAESAQVRAEWKAKLDEALGLRKAVQENNKAFDVGILSDETFLVPVMIGNASGDKADKGGADGADPAWNHENSFTGKVTCTVPLNTPDGRGLVAIGCAEGVWVGFRHDPRSVRRVLHLKMVTQCAVLEDFGIFLVLADKMLFAYHIEALVPSSLASTHATQNPQKVSGNKDVHFFSVGTLHGRTLVIYMKKKGLDSIFHVVEPVMDKINERSKTPSIPGSRFGFRSSRSDWFKNYREFFLPSESYDLFFLKAEIAILCAKGFEIMNLNDLQGMTIPQREDPRHTSLAKRWETVKPLGMFRSKDEEFLLCYTEFGIYVNKYGDPSRATGSIEWEGTAERIALHNPYILLFDTRFIEVRHIQTGRLVQIIPGNDVRCLWDGRGVNISANPTFESEHMMNQELRVHGVMTASSYVSGNGTGVRPMRGAVAQHVFELIPTYF